VKRARDLIAESSPDIVHALRIPFEGILTAKAAPPRLPLVLSVWGNDFTLFARHYPVIAKQTRDALQRANALLTDCSIVLPGGGGVHLTQEHTEKQGDEALRQRWSVPSSAPIIFCPRQFRPISVLTGTLFKSLALVLRKHPEAAVICVGMAGNPVAEKWKRRMPKPAAVQLLPTVSQKEMSELFRLATVSVSPSLHDGTPNTLLEAMACGCFPIAGDIESIREWITHGENGLLCNPRDPESVANAVIRALGDKQMRETARAHNARLIEERAQYGTVMSQAEQFYSNIIEYKKHQAAG
jgi:glycosyltransferase involved in cell wall biosynthesis